MLGVNEVELKVNIGMHVAMSGKEPGVQGASRGLGSVRPQGSSILG